MRVLDVRGKSLAQIDKLSIQQYPARFYRQISHEHLHRETTDADIKEFQELAEREGAVAMFIQEFGCSAYIPIEPGAAGMMPQTEPVIIKGKNFWPKVNATQKSIMQDMGASKVLEVHSDGDLTFEATGRTYVLTTAGELFVRTGIQGANGSGILPQTMPDDDMLKYYKVPPTAF